MHTSTMNPLTEKICGVAIMAGGQSSRMGQDKMLLEIGGETLLERMIRAASYSRGVYIVGREKPEGWPDYRGKFLPDDEPNLGPIGGLRTLLRHIGPDKRVIVIAGDLPRLSMDATYWLREKAQALIKENHLGKHGLVVLNAGQIEPLFAVYSSDCLPLIEENIQAGRRSLRALIERGDFSFIHASHDIRRMLRNTNTPEEWAIFEAENKMTFDEARKYVEDDLGNWDKENVKLITDMRAYPYGWFFNYSMKKSLETADYWNNSWDGALPYFILRDRTISSTAPRIYYSAFLTNWEIENGWRGWRSRLDEKDKMWADMMVSQMLGGFVDGIDEIRIDPSAQTKRFQNHHFLYYRDGELKAERRPLYFAYGLAMWRLRMVADMEYAEEYNHYETRRGEATCIFPKKIYDLKVESQYTPNGERMILRLKSITEKTEDG